MSQRTCGFNTLAIHWERKGPEDAEQPGLVQHE